jgi:hypothetical protein
MNDAVGRPNSPATPARRAVARSEPAPRTTCSQPTSACGDPVPSRWEPVGTAGPRHRRSSGDTRPNPHGMVEGSRSGFLERLADFYAFLADLRNCPGAKPPTRLKGWENGLRSWHPAHPAISAAERSRSRCTTCYRRCRPKLLPRRRQHQREWPSRPMAGSNSARGCSVPRRECNNCRRIT